MCVGVSFHLEKVWFAWFRSSSIRKYTTVLGLRNTTMGPGAGASMRLTARHCL